MEFFLVILKIVIVNAMFSTGVMLYYVVAYICTNGFQNRIQLGNESDSLGFQVLTSKSM